MKQFFSILVFLFIAIPFVYMLFDVSLDIFRRTATFLSGKGNRLPHLILLFRKYRQSPKSRKFGFSDSRAYFMDDRRFNES